MSRVFSPEQVENLLHFGIAQDVNNIHEKVHAAIQAGNHKRAPVLAGAVGKAYVVDVLVDKPSDPLAVSASFVGLYKQHGWDDAALTFEDVDRSRVLARVRLFAADAPLADAIVPKKKIPDTFEK